MSPAGGFHESLLLAPLGHAPTFPSQSSNGSTHMLSWQAQPGWELWRWRSQPRRRSSTHPHMCRLLAR
jgi:hypothetical protein